MKQFRPLDFAKRQLVSICSAFDRDDVPIVMFVFGLSLLGYGASQFHPGLGPVVVGILTVFYAKPLSRWVK
jgi:hypothetical protein